MHLLYVDESGDDGYSPSNTYYPKCTPTQFYIRCGIVLHELKWIAVDKEVEKIRTLNGIPDTIEFHATEVLSGRKRIYKSNVPTYVKNWFGENLSKSKRIQILKDLCGIITAQDITIIYAVINKSKINVRAAGYKEFPKLKSWEFLIERYNLYLKNQHDQRGIIISDAVNIPIEQKHRAFAKAIYTNSLHVQEIHFVESILFEPSHSSNLLQLADVASFAAGRSYNGLDDEYYECIKNKIYTYNGVVSGYGLKEWPE